MVTLPSPGVRARIAVTRAIRLALASIGDDRAAEPEIVVPFGGRHKQLD